MVSLTPPGMKAELSLVRIFVILILIGRNPENLHENIQVTPNDEEARVLGKHLARVVSQRSKEAEDKSIKIHTDKEYNDNPMDRVDVEESIVVEEVKDLDTIYKKCIENCGVDLQVSRMKLRVFR